ncbi:TPA: transposase [Candidatus Marinimicrobia bacterium]|nr:MAG: Transposase IS3/IS911 family protein [Marinimicrobia bacterium 46_47]HAE86575.1 transposase [Candidatus Neomarinimicrobiota bacterium]
MGKSKIHLRPQRTFTEEFKKARVKEYETGEFTVNEISSLYSIQRTVIYRWIHKYSVYNKKKIRVVEMEESSTKKISELTTRIGELERMLGQKQIKIDLLEKMIELAREELGIDVKKNFSTPALTGSGKTDETQDIR